jgi:nitrite reductase (NADH) large subunit
VASILASVFNDFIVRHDTLQDTNDRYLANIQRQGLYSVIPRVPGGEITPKKLMALGRIADKYGLYTKITGGQRVDLFGARLNQLPDIWEELIEEGFESGHAYGKALRTVKSCVGSTWCRFGLHDSVGFAIRVEERYRGIRAPHKLKGAVSGCIRECAEAQSKDFGIIATDKGWNLYVCGNGGARPRHADLLASDIDEETVIKYIDRFLMFYIATADKLTRTSVWLEKLEGGIEHLKDVIIKDSLGIGAQLEKDMQYLVDTYQCEWKSVLSDPKAREKFSHFANSNVDDDNVQLISERAQSRPADWGKPGDPVEEKARISLPVIRTSWVRLARAETFPKDGGRAVRYGNSQIAVFNFESRGEWYATQNKCPHMKDMVLARGLIGDQQGVPKVACPLHKKNFSLTTGKCLGEDEYQVLTFPVKVVDGWVHVELPDEATTERLIGPERLVRVPTAAE